MIIAVYYTVADAVVVFQFFYFNSFNLQAILGRSPPPAVTKPGSTSSWDVTSPSTSTYAPSPASKAATAPPPRARRTAPLWNWLNRRTAQLPTIPESPLITAILDTLIVLFVCTAGFLGWLLAGTPGDIPAVIDAAEFRASLRFDVAGQVLGWLCCVLYLGSRVPQLVMNFRRKSTHGLSALMFVFALLGNSTYVASIFLYETPCGAGHQSAELGDICGGPGGAAAVYARYVLINLSWILGSTVTIFMDLGILGQHLWYTRKAKRESLLAVLSV